MVVGRARQTKTRPTDRPSIHRSVSVVDGLQAKAAGEMNRAATFSLAGQEAREEDRTRWAARRGGQAPSASRKFSADATTSSQ